MRMLMVQLAAIDVFGRGVQFGHRLGHAAGQPHADEQRDQLDDAEEDRDTDQHIAEDAGLFSQGAEQRGVDHRRPGVDQISPGSDLPVGQSTKSNARAEGNMDIEQRWSAGGNDPASTARASGGLGY